MRNYENKALSILSFLRNNCMIGFIPIIKLLRMYETVNFTVKKRKSLHKTLYRLANVVQVEQNLPCYKMGHK